MHYQSDYILRLIEQMGSLIRRALEKFGGSGNEQSVELLEQAVGLALEMDPRLAARLSPQSLASIVEINSLDDRVVGLLVEALESAAGALDADGEMIEAALRRDQAAALRRLLDPHRAN